MKKSSASWRRLIAILLCIMTLQSAFVMIIPTAAAEGTASGTDTGDALFNGDEKLSKSDVNGALHFVVRHDHAVTEAGIVDANGKPFTVIVEGYIIKNENDDSDPGNVEYEYYARAYSADKETAMANDLSGFAEIDSSTGSDFISIDGSGDVRLPAMPYKNTDNGKNYEKFTGFSERLGEDAVTKDGSVLVINHSKVGSIPKVDYALSYKAENRDELFYGNADITDIVNNNNSTLHFIIRHWHVEPDTASETVKENYAVLVEGYIIPSGGSYTCYARAYSVKGESDKSGTLTGFTKIETSTTSDYIKLVGTKIQLPINPYKSGNKYNERFAGFSVTSGQTAVTMDNGDENSEFSEGAKLIIDMTMAGQIHLVKSHYFYTSELATVEGVTQYTEQGVNKDFPTYEDTCIEGNNKKYNAKAGLHTDKTASVADRYGDLRTFDIDLESWFIDGEPINIGMVIDASGSMGFTADTPTPIRLTEKQIDDLNIKQLTSAITNNNLWGSTYFLKDNQIDAILNKNNTDNSRLGNSGYTYYIYDPRGSTMEFAPLGYWSGNTNKAGNPTNDGTNAIGYLNSGSGAGWYYINSTDKWNNNYANSDLQSGKTLNGIITAATNYIFYDTLPKNPNGVTAPGGGTGSRFEPTGSSATKFYVDKDRYLRCFYFVNKTGFNDGYGASYVYELPDEDYIKVEALQRAMGSFVTELESKSPDSLVSATRFSTPNFLTDGASRDKMVLLDWTANARDAQQMLSLQYGAKDAGENNLGGTLNGDKSSYLSDKYPTIQPIEQYNYGLTGKTSTRIGLEAFEDVLQGRLNTYLDAKYASYSDKEKQEKINNSKKFIIIFTDGKDTDIGTGDSNRAPDAVTRLKNDGYTVYCVMLAGGPVMPKANKNDPDGQYEDAIKFLNSLAGPGKGITSKPNQEYVFSTADYTDEGINPVDALTDIFTKQILPQMLNDLETYDVQDYIDPRFDLVDADENVWHLNADGNVKLVAKDGTATDIDLNEKPGQTITFAQADSSSYVVLSAKLYYDGSENANMYYLKWENQTIPGSPEGATRLPTWHSKITIRAKEDFIGGNSVLSNGNSANQNYVHASEANRTYDSSGADEFDHRKDDRPSRGFPRTTVNVGAGKGDGYKPQLKYMGETLSARDVVDYLIGIAKDDSEPDSYVYYYWEYLERYVEYYNNNPGALELPAGVERTGDNGELTLDDLVNAIVATDGSIKIPYYYLPNADESNQTGTTKHEKDLLGYLTYSITLPESFPEEGEETTNKDRKDCNAAVTYEPLREEERKAGDYNFKLVTEFEEGGGTEKDDQIYGWDPNYKETEGDPMVKKEIPGGHVTEFVSGDIILQVELSESDVMALLEANVKSITYTADLMRDYDGTEYGRKIGTYTVTIVIDEVTGGALAKASIEYYNDPDLDFDYSSYVGSQGLPVGDYTLENCSYSFTYSGDEPEVDPFTFYTAYVVSEKDSEYGKKDNFKFTGSIDPEDFIADLYEDEGKITLGDETGGYTDAFFGIFRVSGYPSGKLEITKTVSDGDTTDSFEFTITLTFPNCACIENCGCDGCAASCTGTGVCICETCPCMDRLDREFLHYTFSEDGGASTVGSTPLEENTDADDKTYYTATISLKHGQSVVIEGLPVGTKYTVKEAEYDDYVTVPEEGYKDKTIDMGVLSKAAFDNIKRTFELPATGGMGTGMFMFVGMMLLLPALALTVYRKRDRSLDM